MTLRTATPALIACATLLAAGAASAQLQGAPLMKPPLAAKAPAAATAFRTIAWDALVPAGWDPYAEFRKLDMQSLDDADPRAGELMKKMRQAWDHAPVNAALVGQAVRIPGFVVPLEEGRDGITEFLLVPYFGACVHSPPPPSNQIIHVLPRSPAKGLRSMDTVWVSGQLSTAQTDSFMGAASWRLQAAGVAPYSEPAAK